MGLLLSPPVFSFSHRTQERVKKSGGGRGLMWTSLKNGKRLQLSICWAGGRWPRSGLSSDLSPGLLSWLTGLSVHQFPLFYIKIQDGGRIIRNIVFPSAGPQSSYGSTKLLPFLVFVAPGPCFQALSCYIFVLGMAPFVVVNVL